MTLPNGFKKDLAACLGDRRVADIVYDTLNDVGADGSGSFTTVVATTSYSVSDVVLNATGLQLDTNCGIAFFGNTGTNEITVSANKADALSIKDSAGDLIVLETTTGARVITIGGGVAADSVQVGGVASAKIGFRAATPQSAVTYTITNDVTDRTFDANANSTLELADVVATLLKDLAAMGLLTTA